MNNEERSGYLLYIGDTTQLCYVGIRQNHDRDPVIKPSVFHGSSIWPVYFFFVDSDGKFWAKLAINKFARHCGPIRAEGEIPLGWLRLHPETNQSVTHRPLGGTLGKSKN